MMYPLRLFLFYVVCFIANTSVKAQQNEDRLVEKFNHYRTHALQEKVYAHIDRTSYLTGELLWFKLYYVDGTFHRELDMSKVAYVEIVDKNNNAVVQAKVELKDGAGNGSLFIPAVVNSGNYMFRAYTNWMKNFSPEYYFHQDITIVNPFVKIEKNGGDTKQEKYDVQFFPEGGYAVAGIESKIGFRATDASGKGILFTGSVINSRGDTIVTFRPLRFGIGYFYLTPEADQNYKVIIVDEKRNASQHPFPEVKKTGYTMSVADNETYITVDAQGNGTKTQTVYLFTHTRQVIVKLEGKPLNGVGVQFLINKDELGEGINHLTLFDHELKPVCERLFFKRPEKNLKINIQSSQIRFTSRDLVQLTLQANDNSDVSISVYRKDSISSHNSKNIFEYLWLTSDLIGDVEEPEDYFEHTDSATNVALDNLMLTHGWRRFNWNEVLDFKAAFKSIPEYHGPLIQGKVTTSSGVPVSGVLTSLSSPNKLIQFYGSRSNDSGEVRFEVKDFFNERKIFIHQIPLLDSTYLIKIESPFSKQYASALSPPFQLGPSLTQPILNRSIAMQVQDIYNHEEINRFFKPNVDSVQFYGKGDEVYYLDDYIRFPLVEEVLREYVSSVFVRKRNDRFHFMLLDHINNGTLMREDPIVLLDGVPVLDNNKLLSINALNIKKIEVVGREYHWGPFVFSGILSFFTYRNDMGGFEIDPKSVSLNYEGLQSHREFYSPLYETKQDSRLPDQRTLLYWNASQKIEKQKNTTIKFYTSDCLGDYEVVIEGLTKDGLSGSATYSFSVQ